MNFEVWLRANMPEDNRARFFKKVGALTRSGCLLWRGGTNQSGYGVFAMRRIRHGQLVLRSTPASRAAWELAHGPIPRGMFVCHRCDNPPCVNVSHLFLGTPRDNWNDMISKGRSALFSATGQRVYR